MVDVLNLKGLKMFQMTQEEVLAIGGGGDGSTGSTYYGGTTSNGQNNSMGNISSGASCGGSVGPCGPDGNGATNSNGGL